MSKVEKISHEDVQEIFSISSAEVARIEAEARLAQAEAVVDAAIAFGRLVRRAFKVMTSPIAHWRDRQRGFIELTEMNSLQLADIGLTEGDVEAPANRDFQKHHAA